MRHRDAERVARQFCARYYNYEYTNWEFDLCDETFYPPCKSWSFGLAPDPDHPDYQDERRLTGYVHSDGTVEGMY